ncbi:restriction endonuclease subunit S [Flavobacteriaceae bacterium M23B6Z8]
MQKTNTIHSNEVLAERPGYKNTRLGWIPNDWDVRKLGDLCTIKGEYGINAASVEYSELLPTYLRITDIDDNGHFKKDNKTSVDNDDHNKYLLKNGDIVFARTGATVGKTYLYDTCDGELVFAGFLIRFRPNENELIPKYLRLYTDSDQYWNWVRINSMRSGQPGINGREYSSLPVPLPTIIEQKVITRCLNTWDTAITKLGKLIKARQKRKKALMQQLLTGKKRLPGFYGEWEKLRLGDVTNFFSRRNKELIEARVYSVTNYDGFVYQSDHFSRELVGDDLASYKIIKKNEFAYNPARINVGSIAFFEDEIGIISSLYVCFSTNEKMTDDYLRYFIQLEKTQFDFNRYGEGGVRIYLWYPLFASIKVEVPPIIEQKAISNVLLAADKEIQLLQEQLKQLELQKKGMMQQLLTGKKRLKD